MQEAGVDFALAGALAVGERGHLRLTVDVEVVVTAAGLQAFRERWRGRGYTEMFAGARGVRDSETGVHTDFRGAGEYPGDGRPKAVCFSEPGRIAPDAVGNRVLDLRTVIELRLDSGLSAPDRLQDLADVGALIRANRLAAGYGIDTLVRAKFGELSQLAQEPQREL